MPSRARAPHVPLPRVRRGQQRSLTSSVAGYPQIGIRAGQALDRRPDLPSWPCRFDPGRPLHATYQPKRRPFPIMGRVVVPTNSGAYPISCSSAAPTSNSQSSAENSGATRRARLPTPCTCAHLLGSTPASFSSASSKAQATTSPIRPHGTGRARTPRLGTSSARKLRTGRHGEHFP